MRKAADFITRHKNMLLIALLSVTLLLSSEANRRRLSDGLFTTALPVTQTQEAALAVSACALEQDAAYDRELTALSALIAREDIEASTREAAAEEMQAIIHDRQAREALDTALAATSLAPCTAVISGGSVTIVTAKSEITPEESALALSLASAHAGAQMQNVRILTGE